MFGHFALVLFDSGSTHSFVSEEFVELAHLEKELLEITLSTSTPAHELLLAISACNQSYTDSVKHARLPCHLGYGLARRESRFDRLRDSSSDSQAPVRG